MNNSEKLDNPIILDVSFKTDSYFEENTFSNKNFKKLNIEYSIKI